MKSPQDYRPINKNIPADNALGKKVKRAEKDPAAKPGKTPEQILKERLQEKQKQIQDMICRHSSTYLENENLKKKVVELENKYIKALEELNALRENTQAKAKAEDTAHTVCNNCEKRNKCPFSGFSKELRVRVCPRAQELKHSLRHLQAVQDAENGKPMWEMRKDLELFLSKHCN